MRGAWHQQEHMVQQDSDGIMHCWQEVTVTEILIRKYRDEDTKALLWLCSDEWAETIAATAAQLKKCYDGKTVRCYIAETTDDMIVGFVYGFVLPSDVLIPEFLYVDPEYRRTGIGSRLMGLLERESGCTSAMVFYNKSLHGYYGRRGYMTGENIETAMKDLSPDR